MTSTPIPPPNEPLSNDKETGRSNDVWYRFWDDTARSVNSVTSAVAAISTVTATTYAQTIMAATTASVARTALGVDAADTAGSWTPGIAIGGTTVDTAPSLAVGRYVQTASGMVTVWGTITVTTFGAASGDVSITGLPVRASSTLAGMVFSGAFSRGSGFEVGTTIQSFTCYVTTGSTVINLGYWDPDNLVSPLPSANFTTAANMSVSVSYETTV